MAWGVQKQKNILKDTLAHQKSLKHPLMPFLCIFPAVQGCVCCFKSMNFLTKQRRRSIVTICSNVTIMNSLR